MAKIFIYSNWDRTVTSHSLQETVNSELYRSLLQPQAAEFNYKSGEMKSSEEVQALFSREDARPMHMRPDAIEYFREALKHNEVRLSIVTDNRADYIKELLTYHGFTADEIARINICDQLPKAESAALDLHAQRTEEPRHVVIFDDAQDDLQSMLGAVSGVLREGVDTICAPQASAKGIDWAQAQGELSAQMQPQSDFFSKPRADLDAARQNEERIREEYRAAGEQPSKQLKDTLELAEFQTAIANYIYEEQIAAVELQNAKAAAEKANQEAKLHPENAEATAAVRLAYEQVDKININYNKNYSYAEYFIGKREVKYLHIELEQVQADIENARNRLEELSAAQADTKEAMAEIASLHAKEDNLYSDIDYSSLRIRLAEQRLDAIDIDMEIATVTANHQETEQPTAARIEALQRNKEIADLRVEEMQAAYQVATIQRKLNETINQASLCRDIDTQLQINATIQQLENNKKYAQRQQDFAIARLEMISARESFANATNQAANLAKLVAENKNTPEVDAEVKEVRRQIERYGTYCELAALNLDAARTGLLAMELERDLYAKKSKLDEITTHAAGLGDEAPERLTADQEVQRLRAEVESLTSEYQATHLRAESLIKDQPVVRHRMESDLAIKAADANIEEAEIQLQFASTRLTTVQHAAEEAFKLDASDPRRVEAEAAVQAATQEVNTRQFQLDGARREKEVVIARCELQELDLHRAITKETAADIDVKRLTAMIDIKELEFHFLSLRNKEAKVHYQLNISTDENERIIQNADLAIFKQERQSLEIQLREALLSRDLIEAELKESDAVAALAEDFENSTLQIDARDAQQRAEELRAALSFAQQYRLEIEAQNRVESYERHNEGIQAELIQAQKQLADLAPDASNRTDIEQAVSHAQEKAAHFNLAVENVRKELDHAIAQRIAAEERRDSVAAARLAHEGDAGAEVAPLPPETMSPRIAVPTDTGRTAAPVIQPTVRPPEQIVLPMPQLPIAQQVPHQQAIIDESSTELPVQPPVINERPLSPPVVLSETDRYEDLKRQLNALQFGEHSHVKVQLDKLIKQVDALKETEKMSTLIEVLDRTHTRLTIGDPKEGQTYNEFAKTMQGKPNRGLQILGGIMLALGIAVAILGIVFFPALVGVVAAAGAATAAAAITGTAVGVASAGLAGVGIGFFAYNSQKGLSKCMSDVENAAVVDYVPATLTA